MTRLKIGDKVRVIKSKGNDWDTERYIGKEGIIKDKNGKLVLVEFSIDDACYFFCNELELIKDKKVKGVSKKPNMRVVKKVGRPRKENK